LPTSEVLLHLLLALFVILVAARLVGLAFRRLGQPPVIGEVVAGILLGRRCSGAPGPKRRSSCCRPKSRRISRPSRRSASSSTCS
jgi:Kef-type K+ transport system membrane component KefB